jgi:hypothetical protein
MGGVGETHRAVDHRRDDHAAHVAAACGLDTAHGLATASLLSADVAAGPAVIDGRMGLGEELGLGIGPVSPLPATPS